MSKTFRPWDVDQVWLLPPSIQDLVPAGHVAHFVRETVRDGLDLSRIMDSYEEERGYGQQYTGRQGGCEAVKIAHDGRDFILLRGVKDDGISGQGMGAPADIHSRHFMPEGGQRWPEIRIDDGEVYIMLAGLG